jgi:phage terminase large subunit-like protein
MQQKIIALGALFLSACTSAGTPPAEPGSDACGASGYQSLVGTPLAAAALPADLDARIIRPGMAVTMDFRADRLNIEVNEAGEIVRVYCG